MKAVIEPSVLSGTVEAPPSKSESHRLLLAASLARGESRIRGIAGSEDICATTDCLKALGADILCKDGEVRIAGTDPFLYRETELNVRESGSTLRFLIPLLLLSGREMVLWGSGRLMQRPLSVYEDLCRDRGLVFERKKDGIRLRGPLKPGRFEIPGNISSQFATGLFFALPLLENDSSIRLRPPLESGPYLDLTRSVLHRSGVEIRKSSETEYEIPGGQVCKTFEAKAEGDWSNAAVFLAGGLSVDGLNEDSLQGDKICGSYLRLLDEGKAELPLADCPDLAPVLFAYAAMRKGGHFTGTARLRLKESDRGAAMQKELARFGVELAIGEDEIEVGCGIRPPSEELDGHNDHRIVMALTLLCAKTGGTIRGAEAVNKSFPDFFRKMKEVGLKMKEAEEGGSRP